MSQVLVHVFCTEAGAPCTAKKMTVFMSQRWVYVYSGGFTYVQHTSICFSLYAQGYAFAGTTKKLVSFYVTDACICVLHQSSTSRHSRRKLTVFMSRPWAYLYSSGSTYVQHTSIFLFFILQGYSFSGTTEKLTVFMSQVLAYVFCTRAGVPGTAKQIDSFYVTALGIYL